MSEVEEASLIERIREDILRGELGPGQRLVEAELTDRFGATRGAVRQALVQLDGEGLVQRTRNRGARVRSISLAEAIEITEARAVLEGLCARKAAQVATDAERDHLRDLGRQMADAVAAENVVHYSELAQEIHRSIRVISRQETVAGLLDRLRYQSVRYHFSVALLPGRPSVGLREHREVIAAVVAGDGPRAESVMRCHLESVIAALRELGDRPQMHQPLLRAGH